MNDIQQRQTQQPQPPRPTQHVTLASQANKNYRKYKKIILVAVALLVVAFIGLMVWRNYFGGNGVKKNQYQAIFMTNGQAYIGKLQNSPSSEYLILTDVYTIQVQADASKEGADATKAQQPSLVKLSDQLAGAENEIRLSKNQVSFWENLRDDGKVVQAIKSNTK